MESYYNMYRRIEELEEELQKYEVGSTGYSKILEQIIDCAKLCEEVEQHCLNQSNEESRLEHEEKNNAAKNANAERDSKRKFIEGLIGKGCFIAALLFATVWSVNNPTIVKLAEKLLPVAARM